ncbi:MAG: hypothetical protein ACK4S2_07130 [Gemmobacter sp.]|uniref:hypothetical protein n=1 Tax=Gemmobacter sp. TaxID=1898957 RepID=UPI00391BF179
MTQNTSSAVMQRRSDPHDSLDDFPTPPWATRALCERLPIWNFPWRTAHQVVREPAANRGHMVRPLSEYFGQVEAADVHDYGAGFPVRDYLFGADPAPADWTITNPPFRLAEQFIERALRTSRVGVAVIVRSAFLEGVGRHKRLFDLHPPVAILQFTERVVMHKGRLSPNGSTATAYCWIVWKTNQAWLATGEFPRPEATMFDWIPPSRKALEKPGDYQ